MPHRASRSPVPPSARRQPEIIVPPARWGEEDVAAGMASPAPGRAFFRRAAVARPPRSPGAGTDPRRQLGRLVLFAPIVGERGGGLGLSFGRGEPDPTDGTAGGPDGAARASGRRDRTGGGRVGS